MRRVKANLCLLPIVFSFTLYCSAQQQPTVPPAASGQQAPSAKPASSASQSQVDSLQTQIDKINSDLQKQQESDFGATLGIGSLVINPNLTDYSNQSNVLQATSLGAATPQYLIGVSMRTQIPNFPRFRPKIDCSSGQPATKKSAKASGDVAASPASGSTPSRTPTPAAANQNTHQNDAAAASAPAPDPNSIPACELWRRRPWQAFISLKFSPQSSQAINGYVIGGSWAFAHYIDGMIGFALTPISQPAPGFRVAASNYVTQQQQNGMDLNFNPTAMLNNAKNAFDGFPLTDATGKLIYTGNALATDYRGGAVFGVSVPINFGALFSAKTP